MVLSLMRRHAKSWLIKFLIAIIAIVFIFYFGYSFTEREGVKVAQVNGEVISGLEYEKAYRDLVESVQQQYRQFWSEELIRTLDLRNRALQNLISMKLLTQEARKLGLQVTEREIQDAIVRYPAFQIDGQFDLGRYRALLGYNRMQPEDFESEISQQLLQGKLRDFLSAFLLVTDQEVRDRYVHDNEKVKIGYVQFTPEAFTASVVLDEGGLKKFYEENKEKYRVPEKAKLVYLELDPAGFKHLVKVDEKEIASYYDYNLDSFKVPKEVKARHILFTLARDASPEEEQKAREKASAVLELARQGQDFAELAKQHSDGPTREMGGDLGFFSAGKMVKPFEDAAFALPQGGISDLVRTDFGYHIIKVEEIKEERTKPMEEVREEIVAALMKTAQLELAHEKGLSLTDQMPYEVDLAAYAAEHKLETRPTEFFSQDEPIPGLGGTPELRKSLFGLDKSQPSELIELNEKFYLFQVAERKPSYVPEMAEAAERVKEDLTAELARQAARKAGEAFLEELRKGRKWEELAKEKGAEPKTSDFLDRRGTIQEIGYLPDLAETAFGLGEANPYPATVLENDRGAFVIRWEGRQGIDEQKYQADLKNFRETVAQTRFSRAMSNWLERLKEKADIEILVSLK